MFGFFKNLLRKPTGTPEDYQEPVAPVAAVTEEETAPEDAAVAPPPVQPAPAPTTRRTAPVQNGRLIEIPLSKILAGLPLELQPRVRGGSTQGMTMSIPLEKVLAQLARGTVKISFGELRMAAPDLFTSANDRDRVMVALPLDEIVARLNPNLIQRRRTQRQVVVPDDVRSPFDLNGTGLFFAGSTKSEQAVAAPISPAPPTPPALPVPAARQNLHASPAPQAPTLAPQAPARATLTSAPKPAPPTVAMPTVKPPVAPIPSAAPPALRPPAPRVPMAKAPLPPPAAPPAPKPPAPAPAALGPIAPRPPAPAPKLPAALAPMTPLPKAPAPPKAPVQQISPLAPSSPPPAQPIPMPRIHAADAGNGNGQSASEDTVRRPRPAAANFFEAEPEPAPLVQQSISGDPQEPLIVALTSLADTWPDPVRREIIESNLVEARIALPAGSVEQGLRQARIAFSWKTLRSWIRPAIPAAPSPNDGQVLELPLKIVAPLFLARQREHTRKQQKVNVDVEIPDLFFGFPQSDGTTTPAAPAPAKGSDSNYYVWDDGAEMLREDDTEVKRSLGTQFVTKYATPNEIVSRAAALDGVAGALIALPDGLMVANQLPADLNGETLAAFLPQIFGKVSQCTKELRMGDLNNLNFTVGNIPWKIFRVNAIFFAAFGRAGQPMPSAQLAELAGELDHKPK